MGGRRIFGDANRVGLGANFKKIRANDYFYIDKTSFIEHFLSDTVEVSLICRPRRFGKSLNMDALRCFLTDREDSRGLFEGLAVDASDAWGRLNSAPVFHFDFKGLTAEKHQEQVYDAISDYMLYYADSVANAASRRRISRFLDGGGSVTDGLRLLTEAAHEATGKRSYILIDEYDKLLLDEARSESYAEIRKFMTYLFSAAFKDNPFLEKGLLTGVMRISYEGLFSGLNNIKVFDVFSDSRYCEDFGATEGEMLELARLCPIN
ncbi:MAG: AAA family ATPase, partial [Clostridiales bacterium]|nr:AAA family ATPase [Clostridiales bacterium]